MILLNKPVGLTPLQAIEQLKNSRPELANKTISYAGRLDPMAEGLLLLLVDEENKNRKEFEGLKKTYEFDILLGVETDSYDILGKILNLSFEHLNFDIVSDFDIRISNLLQSFLGKHMQSYPPYSSKTVQGKPLYWWARHNKLDEITIPEKQIEIFDIQLLHQQTISIDDLRIMVYKRINQVKGDFRQDEVLQIWQAFFKNRYTSISVNGGVPLLHCTVTCSSGTYVRSIAHEIGIKLGCGAIALTIKRTQIGKYSLPDN